jgi:hypothetical protein
MINLVDRSVQANEAILPTTLSDRFDKRSGRIEIHARASASIRSVTVLR